MPTKVGTKKCGTCSCMRLENRNVGYCLKLDTARGPLKHGCDKHTPFMVVQCACGCGQETDINPLTKKPSQFVLGHNSRCDVAKEAHARTHNGSSWHKGIKHSDTDRENISKGIAAAWERKGNAYRSEEGLQRLADATRQRLTGSTHTQQAKMVIGEKSKIMWEQVKADPEKFEEKKRLFSSNAKKRINLMTTDEKKEWLQKRAKGHRYGCKSIDENGNSIDHDSGWEKIVYHLFRLLNLTFKYTNTHDTGVILENGNWWFPDFILEDQKIIFEVKGFYIAKDKFYKAILPQIPHNLFKQYTIVSYEKKPKTDYCSLNDILKDCIYHTYQGVTS